MIRKEIVSLYIIIMRTCWKSSIQKNCASLLHIDSVFVMQFQ